MFGSTILDVAMGLIFSFLMISLVTSAVTESIASALSWRANTLLQGVKDLLNDPQFSGLALKVYNHAAVNARSNGTALSEAELTAKPSYIDAKQFAAAVMDVAELISDTSLSTQSLSALQAKVNANVPDAQLNKLLNGMIARAGGNIDRIKEEVAAWFDAGMDRVSGVYKRKVQLWAFFIGLGLAIILNVDTVKIAQALWAQPGIMKGFTPPPGGETPQQAIDQLQAIGVPFGWNEKAVEYFKTAANEPYILAGWLITAIATVFGAPFWFDTLQRFVQLRGTGPQ
jgi:hypothetical protein